MDVLIYSSYLNLSFIIIIITFQFNSIIGQSLSDINRLKEQYEEFFSHIGAGFGKPLITMHNNTEGTISYTNLLCVPSTRPFDLFNPERKSSLKLYINRVYITDKCDALIPAYLRFVKGIVDTQDIDLNVSREMLQNNPAVAKISKSLVGKILRELKKVSEKDKDKYKEIWNQFGSVLKEGVFEDTDHKVDILKISKFKSSNSNEEIFLSNYIERMHKKQQDSWRLHLVILPVSNKTQ